MLKSEMLPEYLQMCLKDLLTKKIGLNFAGSGWQDFELRIAAAAKDAGAADALTYIQLLLDSPPSPANMGTLARHFTVGETYFFRHKASFDALAAHVLPELLQRRELDQRQLRIWSAGCCTGEEAYSIAILLDRLLPQQENWEISIVATDINPLFLQKAERAVYGEWSFRGTPEWVKDLYFTKGRNNTYELIPKIRQRVQFAYLNLAEGTYPSAQSDTDRLDVIVCRNVLMYFSTEEARRVVSRFRAALQENGLLLVSPAETSSTLFPDYSLVHYVGTSFYQPREAVAPKKPALLSLKQAPQAATQIKNMKTAAVNVPRIRPAARPEQKSSAVSWSRASKARITPTRIGGNSESAVELARLARAAADKGNLDNAAQLCEQAIAAEKLNPAFYYLLATIDQERGRIDAAVQALQRTLYLDHRFVLAHFALANLRLVEGRRKDAARYLETVRRLLQDYEADETLAESDSLTVGRLDDIAATLAASLNQDRHTAEYG
ncbi:CheR family methyltransferase [Haliea sp. E1-2-M8]|uniref:CheR family methyltransferase n=1 Tax=Haliea sp. E1-2-M8 TaxID=3064706 RepID=UPI0027283432|nr:CheR family methyltransferase [Haliea sp. E1-2-M8]MDO8863576.1 CheR family methyltransferase [Haliea sp. E1-2-M8]